MLQQPVKRCINTFSVLTQVAQVTADKRKLRLMRIDILYAAYFFYSLWLEDIATQPINSIGWINDHATVLQAFNHLFNQPWLRVFGVNGYQHTSQINTNCALT